MRIDRIDIENFKKFSRQEFTLHPSFTLFIGDNGSGKTSVLDALAVAAGIWLVNPPDSTLQNSGRNIAPSEIRLEGTQTGDRLQFRECKPVSVRASGQIGEIDSIDWTRQIRASGSRTSNADAKQALAVIQDIFRRDAGGESVVSPILAYYGAGRAWLPSNQPIPSQKSSHQSRRWAAFYDCFNERIRFGELRHWFRRETIERGNRGGTPRPGFEAVSHAVMSCVPGATEVRFDSDRDEIVLTIDGNCQPFGNLSAGQRMMLALVADLAIKAVTQNAFLLELGPSEVLRRTPGLILIDELDVHLHPRWQRRVVSDLVNTFPSLQFVCTTHSPQVIGEVPTEQVRVLAAQDVYTPEQTYGMDSNRVLQEVMSAGARNTEVDEHISELFALIDGEDFATAKGRLEALETVLGPNDPEVVRARTLMAFLESPA